jgi:hypothetical protein
MLARALLNLLPQGDEDMKRPEKELRPQYPPFYPMSIWDHGRGRDMMDLENGRDAPSWSAPSVGAQHGLNPTAGGAAPLVAHWVEPGGVQHQASAGGNTRAAAQSRRPFTVEGKGERIVLNPRRPTGKTLYFFFAYTGSKKDQSMRAAEEGDLEDDVYRSAAQGFKVVYDKAATKQEFLDAVYDSSCYGIYSSGHGDMKGSIQTSDGKFVGPGDIDVTRRSPRIQYLILGACGSGVAAKEWEKAMGPQCQFEGWVNETPTAEAVDFTSDSWLDPWFSHNGMRPDRELRDYIHDAKMAK